MLPFYRFHCVDQSVVNVFVLFLLFDPELLVDLSWVQFALDNQVHPQLFVVSMVIHPGDHLVTHTIALSQATQLLQARKSEDDVIGICDMCDKLRVSQIIKILNLYTPAGRLNLNVMKFYTFFHR